MTPLGFADEVLPSHCFGMDELAAPRPAIASPSSELCASVTWSVAPSLDDGPSLSTWTVSSGAGIDTVVERPPLEAGKGGSNVRANYAYDALGRRVKATGDGITTYFVYGLDPLWTKTGTTETRHAYANGMRIARITGSGGSWTTYYHHVDALGSTWRMTDAAKGTMFSTSYEPRDRGILSPPVLHPS
jgi:hypothetical protein